MPQTCDQPPVLQVHEFTQGGLVAVDVRNSGLRQYGWLDCGPMGLPPLSAHGHADTLSFWLSIDGEPLLTDGGTYLYLGAGDRRSYFRGSQAHNTLIVDECDFAVPGGPFQWLSTPNGFCLKCQHDSNKVDVIATHDGYHKKGISLQRRLRFRAGTWTLIDTVAGMGVHRVRWTFHLGDCQVCQSSKQDRELFTFKTADLNVHWKSSAPVHRNVLRGGSADSPGWVSPEFGLCVPQPALVLNIQSRLPIVLVIRWKVKGKSCVPLESSF